MGALSTFKKESRKCPVCENQFKEEFMLTGSMRQVSINMNEELRTFYKDYQGIPVAPFVYEVITCPKCYYSSLISDFNSLYQQKQNYTEKETELIKNLRITAIKNQNQRKELIKNISGVNFEESKNLETSLASFILAIDCYNYFNEKSLPDTKKAVCAIRAAWLAGDLNLSVLQDSYYKEAHKYYSLIANKPDDSGGFKLGPDWGNNFGFEGVRFIKVMLDLRFLDEIENIKQRFEVMQNVRATFSKIRGLGKASQNKRGPLLKIAEDMFEKVQPIYDKLKSKVESGDYSDSADVKLGDKIAISSVSVQPEEPDKSGGDAEKNETPTEEINIYNKAATEIVKYALRAGVKRDSIKDIEKILMKYFEEK
ncbi:MAG TPA: DUF2225 domain-containing protein [bacterium]|nr:DUF2225 domain-containing protein [bacterium]HPN31809.1 DUF2225 domain-containing protein [bacterium]